VSRVGMARKVNWKLNIGMQMDTTNGRNDIEGEEEYGDITSPRRTIYPSMMTQGLELAFPMKDNSPSKIIMTVGVILRRYDKHSHVVYLRGKVMVIGIYHIGNIFDVFLNHSTLSEEGNYGGRMDYNKHN
jgi:hypothetical protein